MYHEICCTLKCTIFAIWHKDMKLQHVCECAWVSAACISTTKQPYGEHYEPTVWCRQTDRTQWFSPVGIGWIHAYLQSHLSPALWESKSPQGHSTACWPFKYLSITAFNFPFTAGPSPLAVTFLRDMNYTAAFQVVATRVLMRFWRTSLFACQQTVRVCSWV